MTGRRLLLVIIAIGAVACASDETNVATTAARPPTSSDPSSAATSLATSGTVATPDDAAAELCSRTEGAPAGAVVNSDLDEASGLVASRVHPGVFWSHNDGPDGRVFAMGSDGADLGVHPLVGEGFVDFEDVAIVSGSDGDDLLLADLGDNRLERSSIRIHRFAEPDPAAPGPVDDVEILEYVYPDRPHNAETLLVDEANDRIVIVTKEQTDGTAAPEGLGPTEPSLVFEGALGDASEAAIELTPVATIDMPALERRTALSPGHPAGLLGAAGVPTGGDVSADGQLVAIRTYETVWLWGRDDGQTVAEALTSRPCEVATILERQGEAVGFDGDGLVTLGEGVNQPLNVIGR
jgi:hypothetical protein